MRNIKVKQIPIDNNTVTSPGILSKVTKRLAEEGESFGRPFCFDLAIKR